MSCDIDGYNAFERRQQRRARKEHRCSGCEQRILPGHRYVDSAAGFDGEISTWKHCERCAVLLDHLNRILPLGEAAMPDFDCGHSYEDIHGATPEEVAALAFWLPGEPLPDLSALRRTVKSEPARPSETTVW